MFHEFPEGEGKASLLRQRQKRLDDFFLFLKFVLKRQRLLLKLPVRFYTYIYW